MGRIVTYIQPTPEKSIDGREIELRKSNTHIEWRYVGEDVWKQLISIDELKGNTGNPGKDGRDGLTPNITIGKITTLPSDQNATAKIEGVTPNLTLSLGIPKGQNGKDGLNGEMAEDTMVELTIVDSVLNLTTDKYQNVIMVNNTTINLPSVNKFTKIHLYFNATEDYVLTLPTCKWRNPVNIETGKYYEFIFTYVTEWLGDYVVYTQN